MDELYEFLMEMDKLKSVNRKTYVTDGTRNENTAEHSWHMAMAVLTVIEKFDLPIDPLHSVKLSLVHDVCEIDPGDLSVFDPNRGNKHADELRCMQRLSALPERFAKQLLPLWEEYEAQQTEEARWVKVLDRMLPFMTNYKTEGRAWRELGITETQVRDVMAFIQPRAPELHAWIMDKVEIATQSGWLIRE